MKVVAMRKGMKAFRFSPPNSKKKSNAVKIRPKIKLIQIEAPEDP